MQAHSTRPGEWIGEPKQRLAGTLWTVSSALLFLALLASCVRQTPTEFRAEEAPPPDASFAGLLDEWHSVEILKQPAGYVHIEEKRTDAGGFVTRTETRLAMRRGSTPVDEVEAVEEIEEDADGRLIGFFVERKLSRLTTTVRGRIDGSTLRVSTEQAGAKPRVQTIPYDSRAVGPRRTRLLLREKLREEGDSVELIVFITDLLRASSQKSLLGPLETVECPSGPRELRRVLTKIEKLPTGSITTWVDADHRQWKSRIPLGDLEMVTYLTTRAAIARQEGSDPPEIYVASSIPLDEPVPASAREVRYRLQSRDPESLETLADVLEGDGQTIAARDESSLVLTVRPLAPSDSTSNERAGDAGASDLERAARPEYLEPNAFLQSDDAGIAAVARSVAAKTTSDDPWPLAQALETWVYQHVVDKNLHTAFASAAEVLADRAGDCTEHAVLLAALARAAGIPSRVVAGLLHHRRTLVGHMWTEVYVRGAWYALDATLGKGGIGADHIALGSSSLREGSAAELFLRLLPVLGGVEVEVIAIDPS